MYLCLVLLLWHGISLCTARAEIRRQTIAVTPHALGGHMSRAPTLSLTARMAVPTHTRSATTIIGPLPARFHALSKQEKQAKELYVQLRDIALIHHQFKSGEYQKAQKASKSAFSTWLVPIEYAPEVTVGTTKHIVTHLEIIMGKNEQAAFGAITDSGAHVRAYPGGWDNGKNIPHVNGKILWTPAVLLPVNTGNRTKVTVATKSIGDLTSLGGPVRTEDGNIHRELERELEED